MKHPVFLLLLCASLSLVAGTSVAYYNTRSFGFDEDASVLTYDDRQVKIFDYEIKYEDLKKLMNEASKRIPKDALTTYIG